MRRLFVLLYLLQVIAAYPVVAQGHYYNNNGWVADANGRPVAYASIRVCTEPATGSPCTPLATGLYSDFALTHPLPNPFPSDAYGNVDFYSADVSTAFHLQISGSGISTYDIPYVYLGTGANAALFSSPPPLGNVLANSVYSNPLIVTAGASGDTNFRASQFTMQTNGEFDWCLLKSNGTTNYCPWSFLPWYQAFYQNPGWLDIRTPVTLFDQHTGAVWHGRGNSFQEMDPGVGTGNYFSCSVSHNGAGGTGVGYKLIFVDSNSAISFPSPICFDSQGYPFSSLGGGNTNTVTYNQPGFYTQVIMARCTGTTESTCDVVNSVVIDPNHVAEGVLSSITACLTKTPCTWVDDGSWANGSLASLMGGFTPNPLDNTTSSVIFGGQIWGQRGANIGTGLAVIGYTQVYTDAANATTPTVTAHTTGATTYNYYTVLHTYGAPNNASGTYTVQGPFTITNGAVSPDNLISMYCTPFWSSWDLLRGDNVHFVAKNLPCQTNWTQPGNPQPYVYNDTTANISGNTYVPPTRDSTGDMTVYGNATIGGVFQAAFGVTTNNLSTPLGFGCELSGSACDPSDGYISWNAGDLTHTGFLTWNTPGGTRAWHLGFDAGVSPDLTLVADSGSSFNIDAPIKINGFTFSDILRNLTISTVTSISSNPAASGFIRLARTDSVTWRNNANGGDLPLTVSVADALNYNGHSFLTSAGALDAGILAATTAVAPYAALGTSGSGSGQKLLLDNGTWGLAPYQALGTGGTGSGHYLSDAGTWLTTNNLYNHSGTAQAPWHVVQDSCVLGTSCAVTLAGSAVFTSSSTYSCVAQDATGVNATSVSYSAGNAFTITGTGTDTIRYLCGGY